MTSKNNKIRNIDKIFFNSSLKRYKGKIKRTKKNIATSIVMLVVRKAANIVKKNIYFFIHALKWRKKSDFFLNDFV